jgi:tRNA threonylcarbamoyladenosine biosynthesis protein TsaB
VNCILGIEASAGTASLALVTGSGELLAELTFQARRTMAERLVPLLDALLTSVDRRPGDVDAVAVGLGPGSFTSLRVALATAKGIALAGDLPVIGIGSLEVLAAGAPLGARRPVCAVIAAPKRHVYAGLYARLSDVQTNCLFGPELLPVEELAARLSAIGQEVVVTGVVAADDRAALEAAGATFAAPVHGVPRAAVAAHLGLLRLAAGERHDVATLTPLYIHPSEAEVRFGRTLARPMGPEDARVRD